MDEITEEVKGHQKVSEFLSFYKKALEAASYGRSSCQIDKLKALLAPLRPHFEFEEKEIFPVIIKKGSGEHRKLVEALRADHVEILSRLDKFDLSIRAFGEDPDYKEVHTVMESGKELVRIMGTHAQREDEQLFPHLKDYEIYLK